MLYCERCWSNNSQFLSEDLMGQRLRELVCSLGHIHQRSDDMIESQCRRRRAIWRLSCCMMGCFITFLLTLTLCKLKVFTLRRT